MKRLLSLMLAGVFAATLTQLPATSPAATATPTHLSAQDAAEIATSYQHLTSDFYKKVDPQTILDSVRATLSSTLKTAGVKNTQIPAMHSADAPGADVH